MKILLIANVFPPVIGGSATVYERLCRNLGRDVVVLAPWRNYANGLPVPGWQQEDASQPFEVNRVELLRPLSPPPPRIPYLESSWRHFFSDLPLQRRALASTLALVDRVQPDIVCLGDIYALYWLGSALRRLRGLPVVQICHGEEITTLSGGSRRYKKDAGAALREYEGFIAVSRFTQDLLCELGGRPEAVHLLLNGVDTSYFSPGPPSEAILNRHDLRDKAVLLTVSRIEEKKGHDMMIRALPKILEQVPEAVYVIVGTGTHLERLRNIVEEVGVARNVVFAGVAPGDDLPDYYRTCDVFVMPNRTLPNGDTEGFGLVFLEAGACGKPVIGGRSGGVCDAVDDNETGFLVNGNSTDEIARAAIRLLRDRTLAAQMGAAGRLKAERSSWQSKAVEFRAILSEIASRKPARAR